MVTRDVGVSTRGVGVTRQWELVVNILCLLAMSPPVKLTGVTECYVCYQIYQ